MKIIKKLTLISFILLTTFTFVGCNDSKFKENVMEIPLATHIDGKHGLPSFMDVYEAWKYDIDTLYIQAGIDDYTNTYLLEKMPSVFTTLINSTNEFDMNVYALINNEMWFNDNVDLISEEITNILTYNKNHKDTKFKGINIDLDASKVNKENLSLYHDNLKMARNLINVHNKQENDNLKLAININEGIKNSKFIENVVDLVDEVIFESELNKEFVDKGKLILDMMDKYENKKVDIAININKNMNKLKSINLLKNADEILAEFNKYKSFNGFKINNYEDYIKTIKTIS